MTRLTQALTPRRTAQLVVWTLLAAFVVLAALMAHPAAGPAGVPVAATHAAAPATRYALGAHLSAPTGAPTPAVKLVAGESGTDLLPAFRWSTDASLSNDDSGWSVSGAIDTMLGGLASLFFQFAAWIWTAVLWAMNLAMSLDAVDMIGNRINQLADTLGTSIMGSGMVAALVLLCVFIVAGQVLKHGGKGMVTTVMAMVVPLAVIQFMLTSVAHADNSANPKTTAAWGMTPAGLAERGSGVVNNIASGMAMNISSLTHTGPGSGTQVYADNPCGYYYNSLNQMYQTVEAKQGNHSSGAVMLTSLLWQDSFLNAFTTAEYGNTSEGKRAICHYLDQVRVVSPEEQAQIAGTTDPNSPFYKMSTDPKNGPFAYHDDQWDLQASRLAWMACSYGNGQASARWVDISDLGHSCQAWFAGDSSGIQHDSGHEIEFHNAGDAANEFTNRTENCVGDQPCDKTAYQAVDGDLGDNTATRLAQSLFAGITALAYLAALLIPALGCSIASIGAAVFISMLPMTLFMLAIPRDRSGNNSGTGPGTKMLKMTGTFILSKGVFLVVLTLMIQFISIFNVLLGVRK